MHKTLKFHDWVDPGKEDGWKKADVFKPKKNIVLLGFIATISSFRKLHSQAWLEIKGLDPFGHVNSGDCGVANFGMLYPKPITVKKDTEIRLCCWGHNMYELWGIWGKRMDFHVYYTIFYREV